MVFVELIALVNSAEYVQMEVNHQYSMVNAVEVWIHVQVS